MNKNYYVFMNIYDKIYIIIYMIKKIYSFDTTIMKIHI